MMFWQIWVFLLILMIFTIIDQKFIKSWRPSTILYVDLYMFSLVSCWIYCHLQYSWSPKPKRNLNYTLQSKKGILHCRWIRDTIETLFYHFPTVLSSPPLFGQSFISEMRCGLFIMELIYVNIANDLYHSFVYSALSFPHPARFSNQLFHVVDFLRRIVHLMRETLLRLLDGSHLCFLPYRYGSEYSLYVPQSLIEGGSYVIVLPLLMLLAFLTCNVNQASALLIVVDGDNLVLLSIFSDAVSEEKLQIVLINWM